MEQKQQIMAALYAFAAQRSGIEFANYGDVSAFRSEQRSITKDGQQARTLLRQVELCDSITAEDIISASKRAYSGRLTIEILDENAAVGACPECHAKPRKPHAEGCMSGDHRAKKIVRIDYCTGQYFPTEYRRAVCAVMSSALWDWMRTQCMPAPDKREPHDKQAPNTYGGVSAGQWLRNKFRKQFGRAIASRWFD